MTILAVSGASGAVSANISGPLQYAQRRAAQAPKPRHTNMVWARLMALSVAAIVAIPTYKFVSDMFDSRIFGLMTVSLLLTPLLIVMHCMLDPCD